MSGVQITGDRKLLKMLKELPGRVASKVNRRAVNLATTPILQAVKAEVPTDHGDLKAAQIKKITSSGTQANGIVGADADYVGENGEKPAKYDHLVVYGHQEEKSGQMTTPNPYIQRGWDSAIGTAQRKYETVLAEGVEKEAEQLGS